MMEPHTIRLRENTWKALDEEASEYGYRNRAEYIRSLLKRRDAIRESIRKNTKENTTKHERNLSGRIDELEARVSALESPAESLGEARTIDAVETAVGTWNTGEPGSDRELRRDALRHALDYLADVHEAKKSDFEDALYPETALNSQETVAGWWEGMIQQGLNHARDHEIVELDGRTWIWNGE